MTDLTPPARLPASAPDRPAAGPGEPVTHVLYLHGFRSSPSSAKARVAAAALARHQAAGWPGALWCPQLPPSPAQAMARLRRGVADWPAQQMAIIGSSLGGYYATVLAEQLGCRAVLLNPAVEPARDLAAYIGEIKAWHSEDRFYFKPEYVDQLAAMRPSAITDPQRYLLVAAKGDEVLDWHEMTGRYPGCTLRLVEGGDHSLSDFETAHLGAVMGFLGLEPPAEGGARVHP